ncbi:methionine adenosyltransferase [Candidatus Peregrinibacteria bacterium]|nr:methionine adenosyltransferase [Candidatus Peregrinibacteria bacterium]
MPRNGKRLFTSESVCIGHPDKMSDQISDAILDAMLKEDPYSRVACETMVKTGIVIVAGEITTKTYVEIPDVVRNTVREIGYDSSEIGFDYHTCAVTVMIERQSADIAEAVDEDSGKGKDLGAGDQGIMFGYACRETPNFMPLPITLSRSICTKLVDARQSGELPFLRPDGKSQVTVEYDGEKPIRVHTVVVSTQHSPNVTQKELREAVIEGVVKKVIPGQYIDNKVIYHINPSGRFVIGGPQGDCGMTGRKIIADTYGGMGHHGGGSFSGKDPTKVDRSATYTARHVAKNVVAAGLADRCEIQISYAIGVSKPLSIFIDTFGTNKIADEKIEQLIQKNFVFKPGEIIDYYDLRRPIYKATARYGHVGVEGENYTWERLEKVDALKKGA